MCSVHQTSQPASWNLNCCT